MNAQSMRKVKSDEKSLKIKENSQIIIKKKSLVSNKIKPNSTSLDKKASKESKKPRIEKIVSKRKESKLERKHLEQAIKLSKRTAGRKSQRAIADSDQTESDYAPNNKKSLKDAAPKTRNKALSLKEHRTAEKKDKQKEKKV